MATWTQAPCSNGRVRAPRDEFDRPTDRPAGNVEAARDRLTDRLQTQ
eukprot:CAMPEP_0115720454 /NCGR_PEP_ID=MMETSP0272-20121206/78550_1 /TAXON_ID=71861 /ORGANISM="Scrippsiella trochoidea, Strain CCMP3099" /LENGTH=46 /DNA_ID= /DNA_START= /DNA_END= /DNA_ORIENTATION=